MALHPRLTVVSGLDRSGRAHLATLIESAFASGLDDVVLLADTDDGPQPVDVATLRAAGVPADTQLVLRPRDLPGAVVVASRSPSDDADDGEPEGVRAARHGLELARRAESVSAATLEDLLTSGPDASGAGVLDIDAARRRRDHAAAVVAAARGAVGEAGGPAAMALRATELAELRAEQDRLADLLASAVDSADTLPVASALAALRAAEGAASGGRPTAAAIALADRWAEHEERWAAAPEAGLAPRQIEDVRDQLEMARVELARAEQYAKPLYVSPEDRALLDDAHDQVRHARARASRKMATPLARRRLEAARAVEMGILQRIGVPSYDAYLLRTSPGLGDLDAADRLEQASARLAQAEARWERVQGDEPEALRALRRERGLLLGEAVTLLGYSVAEAEVEDALRAHRVPVDLASERRALLEALEAAGVAVRAQPEQEAETWLAEREAAATADLAARRRLDEIEHELAAAQGALDAAEATGDVHAAGASAELAAAEAELSAAQAALVEAERVAGEVAAHAERCTEARRALARSERRRADAEAELAHQLQVARDALAVPRPADIVIDEVDTAGVDAAAAEVYVLARIAALRDVGDAGSLPFVLDDPFAELGDRATANFLGLLERVGSVVQIVYLTEDPLVLAWAHRKAPDGAAVRHFGGP